MEILNAQYADENNKGVRATVNGSESVFVEGSDEWTEMVRQEITPSPFVAPVKTYADLRAEDYAEIAEQLDRLWHDIDAGTVSTSGDFYLGNKEVKDLYPKPS